MRVLHINAGNVYGGVETFLVTLARNAHLCPGMKSSFAICFPGRFREELVAAGAPVHSLGAVRTRRFWSVWQARRRLRKLLGDFDVILCHMPWNHAVFGTAVKRAGKPLVFWLHNPAIGSGWLEWWARRTTPDLVIANSRFTAASLPLLFAQVPHRIIHYPVASREVVAADALAVRQEFGASRDTVVIVQVSRMEAWKGHRLHLQALAELKDLPGWMCWMVGGAQMDGEPEYLNGLKQQAVQFGIADRVRFLGQRADVPQILAASDIFCQPNASPEPFGIVFIEALQTGLPVVATRSGGAVEILQDERCLVEPGDHRALAERLRHLVKSPEERRIMGRRGPERARSLCDPGTQMDELHRTLSDLARGAVSMPTLSNH
ncbi:MAG: glycosyltransferase family 4 protein [Acidobacteriia bacterium]|nr:glycosyltransferase family 4 protein [Terriglobia bacterium]